MFGLVWISSDLLGFGGVQLLLHIEPNKWDDFLVTKDRLIAFSDGVIAILITIMVLEFKMPQGATLDALTPLIPVFLSYILSFIYIGIYWSNHHHMLQVVKQINGASLWANLHLLFWLSLVPFATGWVGENYRAPMPIAIYGALLFMAGVAYYILGQALIRSDGPDSMVAAAFGRDVKGRISIVIYAVAVGLAFVNPWLSIALYVAVAIMWIVPDRRIEREMRAS